LFEGKKPEDYVRVWVAGCATGEEAYSIAMLLAEFASNSIDAPKVQVFATDLDEWAISKARDGYYTLNDAADVSPERLRRFFYKEGEGFRVRRELREMVLFAKHNVIKDPAFSHVHLISCRNLMIYLNRSAQSRLLEILHFALNPNGLLFLGTSESIEGSSNLFTTADKEHHVFRRRPVEARLGLPMPQSVTQAFAFDHVYSEPAVRVNERLSSLDFHLRLLEEYGPPSILVNEEYDILHLSENAGQYLKLAGGEPTKNLLKLVRPELSLELRSALYQATHNRKPVEVKSLPFSVQEKIEHVNITVRPVVHEEDASRGFILVLFAKAESSTPEEPEGPSLIQAAEPIACQLEEQLVRLKAELRATIEQSELQTEELKASNEELQAMNEELRSSTEELETSQEELQSLNEELTTVNQELKIKIDEITQRRNDVQNLINSTDIATIFLDHAMRIRLFTPRTRDIFNLIPADVGRALSDITNKLLYDELISDIESVMDTLQIIEREVETHDRHWYTIRLVPYRTAEDRIDGAVLSFFDVTDRRLAQARVRESQAFYQMMENVSDFAILLLDHNGIIQRWNIGAEKMFGYTSEEATGKSGAVVFTPEDLARGVFEDEIRRAHDVGRASDERWHIRKDGSRLFISGVLSRVGENSNIGYVKIARDLTQQMKSEEVLREAHEKLESTIAERTRELESTNEALRAEISDRVQAERLRVRLLRQIVRAQEDERRRVARDIHDQLGQQMTALRLKLEAVKEMCREQEELCEQLDLTQSLAEDLDRSVDFLAWELRPAALDDLGLEAAVSDFVKEWSKYSGVQGEFHTSGLGKERLAPETETNLYRITQEALNNTMKHAGAKRANVLLERRDSHIVLIVEDDGVGFEVQSKDEDTRRLGLTGMRERAIQIGGSVEIESKPQEGTTIFARVPASLEGEEE
jgi:two-component system CheB/CheR fusion protein